MQVENRAVGFLSSLRYESGKPITKQKNIDSVAAVEHSASGGDVYRASHQEKTTM